MAESKPRRESNVAWYRTTDNPDLLVERVARKNPLFGNPRLPDEKAIIEEDVLLGKGGIVKVIRGVFLANRTGKEGASPHHRVAIKETLKEDKDYSDAVVNDYHFSRKVWDAYAPEPEKQAHFLQPLDLMYDATTHQARTQVQETIPGLNSDFAAVLESKDLTQIMHYLGDFATCLQLVHEADIIHRDVSPKNFLKGDNQVTKIIDFGFAIEKDDDNLHESSGISYYMPAEAYDNKPLFTVYSDTYALAVIYFDWLIRNKVAPTMKIEDQRFWFKPLQVENLSWFVSLVAPQLSEEKRSEIINLASKKEKQTTIGKVLNFLGKGSLSKSSTEDKVASYLLQLKDQVNSLFAKALSIIPEERYEHATDLYKDTEQLVQVAQQQMKKLLS